MITEIWNKTSTTLTPAYRSSLLLLLIGARSSTVVLPADLVFEVSKLNEVAARVSRPFMVGAKVSSAKPL